MTRLQNKQNLTAENNPETNVLLKTNEKDRANKQEDENEKL